MILGDFQFSLKSLSPNTLSRTTEFNWSDAERIGDLPNLQNLGISKDQIEIEGVFYPKFIKENSINNIIGNSVTSRVMNFLNLSENSGYDSIEAIRTSDLCKIASNLISDSGEIIGKFVITSAQIKAFRLIANRSANWADWDEELLKIEFQELEKLNFDLSMTGFDLDEIAEYLKEDEECENNAEEFEEKDFPITSKVGDLWILGKHRLLCGDSTNENDVQKLMNENLADMIFTDPPYNVKVSNISGINKEHKHAEFLMASGEMSVQEFIDFLSKIFKNLVSFSKNGSLHYVCMDWKHIYEILTAAKENYSDFKQLCIWNKVVGGMGNFYRSQHELIFVFKNGNEEKSFHGNRTNIWTYPGMNSFATENRDELLAAHPTVKSLPLVKDAILDASDENDLILDLFGGSGTTLIASEETNRRCNIMELDPKYVDTIIRRWQKQTGEQAILESTGKTFKEIYSERDIA